MVAKLPFNKHHDYLIRCGQTNTFTFLGPSPAGFSDNLTDQSSDKESATGSQTDLRKIPSLPAPSDFLSNSGNSSGTVPKLMTPDAFMTPSTSVGGAVLCVKSTNGFILRSPSLFSC